MAKKKTANAVDCMAIMKEHFDNTVSVDWHGLEIHMKKTLTFEEMVDMSAYIVNSCYTKETGAFRPEIRDFTIRSATVKYYTDLVTPESVGDLYAFLYSTDIFDAVYNEINKDQYHAIIDAVNKKICAYVDEGNAAVAYHMNQLLSGINDAVKSFGEMFGGISADDIKAVTDAMVGGGNIEERLISAYAKMKADQGNG